MSRIYEDRITINGRSILSGTGSPDGVVAAERGALYLDGAPGIGVWQNDDGASSWTLLGGGGPDTFTAPNEWYVDPDAPASAATRTYPTISEALANAVTVLDPGIPVLLRLKEFADPGSEYHHWSGTNMPNDRNVHMYCPAAYTSSVFFEAPFSVSVDSQLTLENIVLVTDGLAVELGFATLVLNNCQGGLVGTVIDAATPAVQKSIYFQDNCRMDMQLLAADTDGGAFVLISDSTVQTNTGIFIDNSAALSAWFMSVLGSVLFASSGADVGLLLDTVDLIFVNSTLNVGLSGSFNITLSNWTVLWDDGRVVVTNEFFNQFLFGDPGFDFPFQEVEGGLTCWFTRPEGESAIHMYPTDAPIGTTAMGNLALGPVGIDYSSLNPQWRGPLDSVRLAKRTTDAAPAANLVSVLDGTEFVSSHFAGTETKFYVEGKIIVSRSGSANGAAWEFAGYLRQTSANVFSWLSGPALTELYNNGAYVAPSLDLTDDEGLSIAVDSTVPGGNNDWTATLQLFEQTIGVL